MAGSLRTFGDKAFSFYRKVAPHFEMPSGIQPLMPFENPSALEYAKKFYRKFFSDTNRRIFIIGINPGRFGAGTTGISFTDPVRLENDCGITNDLPKKPELSSVFIYRMIEAYGGIKKFYDHFFLTAICPVGFIRDGKNINYYDDKNLLKSVEGYIVESMNRQIAMGAHRRIAICLGEGKNFAFFTRLNERHQFFGEIVPLAHPRFIMQYRRKRLEEYMQIYTRVLNNAVLKTQAT